MLYTKIQPYSLLGSGETGFLRYGIMVTILFNSAEPYISTNFQSLLNTRFYVKFEDNWPIGFRGQVVQRRGRSDGRPFSSGELNKRSMGHNAHLRTAVNQSGHLLTIPYRSVKFQGNGLNSS